MLKQSSDRGAAKRTRKVVQEGKSDFDLSHCDSVVIETPECDSDTDSPFQVCYWVTKTKISWIPVVKTNACCSATMHTFSYPARQPSSPPLLNYSERANEVLIRVYNWPSRLG